MNQGVCFSLTRYWMDSLRTGTTNQFFFDLTQPDSSTVTNVVDAQASYLDGFDDLNAVPPCHSPLRRRLWRPPRIILRLPMPLFRSCPKGRRRALFSPI